MAYVVCRPKGRYEIRESVHTPKGPRARSLANFATLTDEVLEVARRRANRPFDQAAVRASAQRAGSPVRRRRHGAPTLSRVDARRFVEASRRMSESLEAEPRRVGATGRRDPGDVLIDLLGFAEQVQAHTPRRQGEPLTFPPLARLAAERQGHPADGAPALRDTHRIP